MEKLIYAIWNAEGGAADGFIASVRDALEGAPLQHLTVNVSDAAVAAGAALRQQNSGPLPAAFVSFWLPSAQQRGPWEAALSAITPRIAGFVVSESTPLHSGIDATGRADGFFQVAMLQQPRRLTRAEWLHHWLDHHTQVAIDTQSTFYYAQNVVSRRLHADGPAWDAIVEEGFPASALTDPAAFFDAVGDEERLQRHTTEMMRSCAKFIDFDAIDVLPTSRYRLA